jgi:hypothetical protein
VGVEAEAGVEEVARVEEVAGVAAAPVEAEVVGEVEEEAATPGVVEASPLGVAEVGVAEAEEGSAEKAWARGWVRVEEGAGAGR